MATSRAPGGRRRAGALRAGKRRRFAQLTPLEDPVEESPRGGDERAAPALVLGVIVAPGLAQDVTERVVEELLEDLREHYGSVDWQIEFAVDRLVSPPALVTEIFDAARRRLLPGRCDLALAVTDLPLRRNRRPAVWQVSRT